MLDTDWISKGKNMCATILQDCQRGSQSTAAAHQLAGFWQRTQRLRDKAHAGGDEDTAQRAAAAVVARLVTAVVWLVASSTAASAAASATCEVDLPILIGQTGCERSELVGSKVVLQTLELCGGLYLEYQGQNAGYAPLFKLVDLGVWRYGEAPGVLPPEEQLRRYLWKLKQHNPTSFALRLAVKRQTCCTHTYTPHTPHTQHADCQLPHKSPHTQDMHVAHHDTRRLGAGGEELVAVGYIFGRVSSFACRCLELGPVWMEKAAEFVQTDAWKVLVQHAFAAGIARVEVLVDTATSHVSLTRLLRLGNFRFEGTHRGWFVTRQDLRHVFVFSIGAGDYAQVSALHARRMRTLRRQHHNQSLFSPQSEALEFQVAIKNAAIGIEFPDAAPIFAKSIHPTKGRGLPETLTKTADEESGPFLVAVDAHRCCRVLQCVAVCCSRVRGADTHS